MRGAATGVEEISPESSRKRGEGWIGQDGNLGNTSHFRRRWGQGEKPGEAEKAE